MAGSLLGTLRRRTSECLRQNPTTLQCTAKGLSAPCDRRNMKARRRNRVSEPDPSKEGPVSKGIGLLVPSRELSIRRAKSMLRKFKSLRRDYPAMLSVVVILLGTFVLGGIAYTYTHRPTKLFDAASHLLERHKVPADL